MYYKKILCGLIICYAAIATAWTNHAAITYYSLPDNSKYSELVTVETLNNFLQSTKDQLPAVLDDIEQWAQKTQNYYGGYSSLPQNIKYNPHDSLCSRAMLDLCFLTAIRVNLTMPLLPVAYDPENKLASHKYANINDLAVQNVLSPITSITLKNQLKLLNNGEIVAKNMIIAFAAEQPDFGLDVGLYKDNQTTFGKVYRFGKQPIGVAALPYTSQVLFHSSTYQTYSFIKLFKPGIQYSYAEYRYYVYAKLSQLAQNTGHKYWATVFAGWAIHYAQDILQPYHADLVAGLWRYQVLANIVSMTSLTNKIAAQHTVFENMEGLLISNAIPTSFEVYKSQLVDNLSNEHDDALRELQCSIQAGFINDQLAAPSKQSGYNLVHIIKADFPAKYVDNGNFVNLSAINYEDLFNQISDTQKDSYIQILSEYFIKVGAVTRNCTNMLLK